MQTLQQLIDTNQYNPFAHAASVKTCGTVRGNGGGWGQETRYSALTNALATSYISETGAIVPPLRKRFRASSNRKGR